MKTKDDMLKVIKKWYSDIADIREKHDLVVVRRDNAGENKSQEIMEFIQSYWQCHMAVSSNKRSELMHCTARALIIDLLLHTAPLQII